MERSRAVLASPMRYLYGDSAQFQLQYDFLATLDAFITSAARAVKLERELVVLQSGHAASAAARAQSLGELERFHRAVVAAVHECALHATTPSTVEFARHVEEHASQLLEAARRGGTAAAAGEEDSERVEADKRRAEVRSAIETFLTAGQLPTLETQVSLELQNGRNELSAVFTNPLHIVTSFRLSVAKLPEWQLPRKVSDFVRGVSVQIGVKKSWISRSVQPELVELDDFVISAFTLGDDAAELHLRRKPDAKDALVFHLRRADGELTADMQRPGEPENEHPTSIDASDRAQLEQVWLLLRAGVGEALAHKEKVLSVEMDGKSVFEGGSALPFFQRLVKFFAPVVVEIAKRSPNRLELSLKHEDDAGRREEIYLKKQDLYAKLEPLDAEGRALFAPLGLGRAPSASGDVEIDVEE